MATLILVPAMIIPCVLQGEDVPRLLMRGHLSNCGNTLISIYIMINHLLTPMEKVMANVPVQYT